MAYDQKNAYPDGDSWNPPRIEGAGGKRGQKEGYGTDDKLEKKCLDKLRKWRDGMDKLQHLRAKYRKFYNADKLGNEVDGRSQVVMSPVADKIDSVMPSFMRIFFGGKNIVDITPRQPGSERAAELMEQKVNYDFQVLNNGFKLIYSFLKDAMIYKMGVIKYFWVKKTKYKKKRQSDMNPQAFMAIKSQPEKFRIDKITVKMVGDNKGKVMDEDRVDEIIQGLDPTMMPLMQMVTIDLEYSEIIKISEPRFENLPPEEFIFDVKARELKECFHKKKIHKNKLKDYGLTKEEIDHYSDEIKNNWDVVAERFKDIGGGGFVTDDPKGDHVFIYEGCILDYDESGEEVPKIVRIFGDKIIGEVEDNEYGQPNYVVVSPILEPHRLCGQGLAERLVEVQRLQTSLMRYILDSIYFSTNGSHVINPFRIDLDSMLAGNRPGGVVVTLTDIEPSTAIFPLKTQPLNGDILSMIEQVEAIAENRTGITRYNQGLDASSLNKTAHGINAIMSASQQRIELMSRILAETGLRDLYKAAVRMNVDFCDMPTNIRLNKNWITITPEQLEGEFDVMLDIGAATGTKEMSYQQMVQMLNTYQGIGKALGPRTLEIFDIPEIKNMLRQMWEYLGFRDVDQFIKPDVMQGGLPNIDAIIQQQQHPQQQPGGPQAQQPGIPQGPGGGGQQPPQPPPAQRVLPNNGNQVPQPPMGVAPGR